MSPPTSVKVFLSYSHKDEALKEKLDAHLSALKRSGIVETWSDRKIPAGEDWKKEIDKRLLDADVVLLLISSDFLASDYCYFVETANALDRHHRGQAKVIPVVLRPVDFHGLPLADLQMLPKDARPVTSESWPSEDEAFKNVAQGLGAAIDDFLEAQSLRHNLAELPKMEVEARYLDAAVAHKITVDTVHEVVTMVRLPDSKGLAKILPQQSSQQSDYSCLASDIRSEPFDARFPIGPGGARVSPRLRLTIDAPDLTINDADKTFALEWSQDSIRFAFLVKATKIGEHRVRVNLFTGDISTAEVLLKTSSGTEEPPGPGTAKENILLASVRLALNVISKTAVAHT